MERETTVLSWDCKRIELLESLIKPTAEFCVELDNYLGRPSVFDYHNIIQDHSNRSCDPTKVRGWVFAGLLRKAVQDANAVALLRSESLWSQAFNLWRSLFETDVVCQYVGDKSWDDHLTCRYVIHSIIRSTVRRWEEFNEICRRLGKSAYYSTEDIEHQRVVYKELVGKWGRDYTWTNYPNHNTLKQIAQATKSEMLFYRIANNEVHPTFGEGAMLAGLSLPLPAVPFLPVAITYDVDEMSLEFQTAKLLSHTTQRVTDYTFLTTPLQESMTNLKELGEAVLRDLSQARA